MCSFDLAGGQQSLLRVLPRGDGQQGVWPLCDFRLRQDGLGSYRDGVNDAGARLFKPFEIETGNQRGCLASRALPERGYRWRLKILRVIGSFVLGPWVTGAIVGADGIGSSHAGRRHFLALLLHDAGAEWCGCRQAGLARRWWGPLSPHLFCCSGDVRRSNRQIYH